ncbi:MAG: metallophosphoesterase [Ignavibacteria bacterium]|nr:metallophosphoesterase [Ignavibacteria bacterium]
MSIWRRILFFTIVFSVFFGLQFLVFRTFRNFIVEKTGENSKYKLFAVVPFLLFNLPYIYIIANGFSSANIPQEIYQFVFIPFYIFQGAVIFIGLYLLIGKIIKAPFSIPLWILNKFEGFREKYEKFTQKKPVQKFDKSRRAFVRSSAAVVSGYAFIGATAGVVGSDDFEVTDIAMKINNLPTELDGTTITLISDIHSGPYMKENMMEKYVEAINELGSDMILIPGDLTNSNKSEALTFSKAFRNLKARHGAYASLGNHDYFSDANYITDAISSETPLKILRNGHSLVNIKGRDLLVLGSEDTRQSGGAYDPVLMGHFQKTMESAKSSLTGAGKNFEAIPKILLFHKPYFFDEISEKGVDLMLSGHTHGGQVVLAKFGSVNLSFAGAVSKYISGLYEKGNSKMYVSRGIGNVALPIRFNCSPEITKITLRA